ncbi:hypothetical protein KY289_008003 [Solanum tuberosum]|nr:hypothetical protein KY289_008003 [Solanum tuberosum]
MDSGSSAYLSMADPFLVEALQNPRHRLTILRMELDIQKFLQSTDVQQFEYPHFPTSYLHLAAHRVPQHYGLQTMVQDSVVDGQGAKILVTRKPESKYPGVRLSDIPPKQSNSVKMRSYLEAYDLWETVMEDKVIQPLSEKSYYSAAKIKLHSEGKTKIYKAKIVSSTDNNLNLSILAQSSVHVPVVSQFGKTVEMAALIFHKIYAPP